MHPLIFDPIGVGPQISGTNCCYTFDAWKELVRVFYLSLSAQRLKIPAPWGPWPGLFVFIHLVLDLNREQNPYISEYFMK